MQNLGLLGMPRRIYTYPSHLGWDGLNLWITIGAVVLGLGILLSLHNFLRSLRRGEPAGDNPWNADGLEWSTSSPPAVYGSEHIPSVVTRHPLWDEHDEEEDPRGERVLDRGRLTLSTSTLDAEPRALAQMPEDTLMPLLSALALTLFFAAVLGKWLWLAGGGALATLAASAIWLWPEPGKLEHKLARAHAEAPDAPHYVPLLSERDQRLGTRTMWLFIATEATLFVMLFFSYFYLGPWPTERPPKLDFALPMLGVLLVSSGVLHWGESCLKRGLAARARGALAATLALGAGFLVLQALEYREHLKTLTPQSNSYGSIFYTLTSLHGLHLLLGLCMLGYVLVLPELQRTQHAPHHAYANASRYWHFVDMVWVVIVGVVYVLPRLT
jgi:cytochrome c oxidase subunit I+III